MLGSSFSHASSADSSQPPKLSTPSHHLMYPRKFVLRASKDCMQLAGGPPSNPKSFKRKMLKKCRSSRAQRRVASLDLCLIASKLESPTHQLQSLRNIDCYSSFHFPLPLYNPTVAPIVASIFFSIIPLYPNILPIYYSNRRPLNPKPSLGSAEVCRKARVTAELFGIPGGNRPVLRQASKSPGFKKTKPIILYNPNIL